MASVIAAQIYTVREFLKTPADIANSVRKLREIGYEAMECAGAGPIDAEEMKQISDGEGVAIISAHESLDELRTDVDAIADRHLLWGCKNVAIGGIPGEERTAEGYANFAKVGNEIGRRLAEKGLTFSYHNHHMEFERFNGRLAMDIIYGEGDPQYLLAQLDVHWVQRGGGDPIEWIRKMKGREVLLHMKDMGVRDREPIFAEVGEGNINMRGCIEAAKECGIEWYIVEQDTCDRDPFESMKISFDNLRQMGLE